MRPDRRSGESGFTLVEVLICALVLTVGLIAIAALLGVTTQMHVAAREVTRSTRLAQEKLDELMKLNLATSPAVAIGGSLANNVGDHFDTPLDGVTLRWAVQPGPAADTRVLTVRVINLRARQYGREVDLSTIIRQW